MSTLAEKVRAWAKDADTSLLLVEGFDKAFMGVIERCGQPPIAIYDRERCIERLMKRDGMSPEGAEEFFSFNVEGAWVGEGTPGFLWRPDGLIGIDSGQE
jgi:hypothetical protein